MAYNTKPIITDVNGNPISQYYNKELDQYEAVEGQAGANKVMVQNNDLSLIPILEKLSELTGTVIDEETRKSNELQRIVLYNQISQMLIDGDLKGDKGDIGLGLEFNWQGTSLGVRVQGQVDYIYVDLKGPKGDKGDTGSIENLNAQHVEDALGYVPADDEIIGMLSNLTTTEKANLVAAINELKSQSNDIATVELPKKVNKSENFALIGRDNRNVSTKPNHYMNAFNFAGLKDNTVINLPVAGLSHLVGVNAWQDTTAGAYELAFSYKGLFTRSNLDTENWQTWKELATTDKIAYPLTPINGFTKFPETWAESTLIKINNMCYFTCLFVAPTTQLESVTTIVNFPFTSLKREVVWANTNGEIIPLVVTGSALQIESFPKLTPGAVFLVSGMFLIQ